MILSLIRIISDFIKIFCIFIIVTTTHALGQTASYFQQGVSYEIQVALDIHTHMLSCHEKLTYTNHSPDTLTYVWFHLYPNAYKDERSVFAREEKERGINDFFYTQESDRGNISIENIHIDGTTSRLEDTAEDESEMKIFLPHRLAPGDSIDFIMDFSVKIPRFLSRLGHDKLHYEITQWYPKIAVYDTTGWHHDGYHILGEFYGDYGTFNVAITLPENMWIAASGVMTSEEETTRLKKMLMYTVRLDQMSKDSLKEQLDSLKSANKQTEKEVFAGTTKLKTVTFTAENVHDFAWVCDYRYLVRKTEYANISLYLFVLPEDYIAWKPANQYASDAVAYMSQWYGGYIYPILNIVDSFNPYGGMEYPNLVLCAVKDQFGFKLCEQVVFHEIGHQWFYGMLGNNEMDDSWLDEGLTEFCEMRYFTEKYHGNFNDSWIGKVLYGNELINHTEFVKTNLFMLSSFNPSLPPASDKAYMYHSRVEFSNVYLRPAFALNMLQHNLGDSVFNMAMRAYYSKNLLHHVTSKSLISAFNETTHQDWQWYFDQWVYSNKQCDYKAGTLRSQNTSGIDYLTTFEVIRADSIIMPVTVEFKTEKDNIIRKQVFAENEINIIEFHSTEKVISARIDPDRNLLEFNPRNNSTAWNGIRLSSIFPTQSFYQSTLFAIPWPAHNSFDGWGYGGASLYYALPPSLYGNESLILGGSAFYYPQASTWDYSLAYRSTTNLVKEFNNYFIKYHKWQGEIKSEIGFEYRLGQYKFEHPSHNFLLHFSYEDIFDERYDDPSNVQKGKDVIVGLRYTVGLAHSLFTHQFDIEIQKSLNVFDENYDYTKVTLEGYNDIPLSRRFSIANYTNAGMIDGTYPSQAGLFISPSGRTIFSDFGSFVGYRYLLDQNFSGGLAGYINENFSGRYLLSTRVDLNVNLLNSYKGQTEPIFLLIFFEGAKIWQPKNVLQSDNFTFLDAGIGIKLIGVEIDLPVWKNYSIVKDGTVFSIQPDKKVAFHSILVRINITYAMQFALELK